MVKAVRFKIRTESEVTKPNADANAADGPVRGGNEEAGPMDAPIADRTKPYLTIENVNKRFGNFQALSNISLTINEGEDVFLSYSGGVYPFKVSYAGNQFKLTYDQNPVIDADDFGVGVGVVGDV
jgi:hypothetical protein